MRIHSASHPPTRHSASHPPSRTLRCLLILAISTSAGCASTAMPAKTTPSVKPQPKATPQAKATPPAKVGQQSRRAPSAALPILRSYTGRVQLAMAGPGSREAKVSGGRVLRDQAAFEAFIRDIPKRRVQKRQPAPPSKDPLLKKPAVDFAKEMVLVYDRDDMYTGPKISKVLLRGKGLEVLVELPNAGETRMLARVYGMGTYHAVVVPRHAGPVTFRVVSGR